MDWAKAIEINQAALARIIAALFAMLGLAEGGILEKPPQAIRRAVLRILAPAESAVRRLIIVMARKLKLEPFTTRAFRPMPRGLAIVKKGNGRVAFQLFDSRKRFTFGPRKRCYAKVGPRIWSVWEAPPTTYFCIWPTESPEPAVTPAPEPQPKMDSLGRRLAAIKSALDDLPRQARRYLSWQEKRNAMPAPKFKDPLRPGQPPGHRKEPVEVIDAVLKECHWLAREALSADTS